QSFLQGFRGNLESQSSLGASFDGVPTGNPEPTYPARAPMSIHYACDNMRFVTPTMSTRKGQARQADLPFVGLSSRVSVSPSDLASGLDLRPTLLDRLHSSVRQWHIVEAERHLLTVMIGPLEELEDLSGGRGIGRLLVDEDVGRRRDRPRRLTRLIDKDDV